MARCVAPGSFKGPIEANGRAKKVAILIPRSYDGLVISKIRRSDAKRGGAESLLAVWL
jgi:hypothetical protein